MKARKDKRRVKLDLEVMKAVVRMARFRLTNREIGRRLGVSEGQATYRLRLYKEQMEMEESVRQCASHGNDPFLERLLKDNAAVMDAEFDRRFKPTIIYINPLDKQREE